MIKTFLTGRLGKDAEVKTLEGGKKVMNYSVAVEIGYGENKSTLWVDCAQWSEKTGVAEYLKKGTQVAVTGEPGIRKWEGGAAMTLRVDKVELLGGNKPAQPEQAQVQQQMPAHQPEPITPPDDLPF